MTATSASEPVAGRGRRRLRIVAVSLAVQLGLILVAEAWLRTRVPECGVTPFRLSELETLSSELRPGFETRYKGVDVSINSSGFRGPAHPPREEGVLRVALVGDSFAFGSAVPFEDTIGERLEDALAERGQPAVALNFGVPGYSALEVATVVDERALAADVDVVLWIFFSNDTEPPRQYDSIPQDRVIEAMHDFSMGSALAEWLVIRARQTAARLGRPLEKRTPEFSRSLYEGPGGKRVRRSLEAMQEACAERGARLVVAAYPHLVPAGTNPFRPIDEGVRDDARELDIEFVDLLETLGPDEDLTVYWAHVFDHHPNRRANERVAATLAEVLVAGER